MLREVSSLVSMKYALKGGHEINMYMWECERGKENAM
jgi:hypothetical protein